MRPTIVRVVRIASSRSCCLYLHCIHMYVCVCTCSTGTRNWTWFKRPTLPTIFSERVCMLRFAAIFAYDMWFSVFDVCLWAANMCERQWSGCFMFGCVSSRVCREHKYFSSIIPLVEVTACVLVPLWDNKSSTHRFERSVSVFNIYSTRTSFGQTQAYCSSVEPLDSSEIGVFHIISCTTFHVSHSYIYRTHKIHPKKKWEMYSNLYRYEQFTHSNSSSIWRKFVNRMSSRSDIARSVWFYILNVDMLYCVQFHYIGVRVHVFVCLTCIIRETKSVWLQSQYWWKCFYLRPQSECLPYLLLLLLPSDAWNWVENLSNIVD